MKRQIGRSKMRASRKHNKTARYRAKLKRKVTRRRMRVKGLLKGK